MKHFKSEFYLPEDGLYYLGALELGSPSKRVEKAILKSQKRYHNFWRIRPRSRSYKFLYIGTTLIICNIFQT